MSDVTMFPNHRLLESRTLEAVVFRWDGTEDQALDATAELDRELKMRDASLNGANYRAVHSIGRDRGNGGPRLDFVITRRSDGRDWRVGLHAEQWLVLWLHEYRLYEVEVMSTMEGDKHFRPVRPVVDISNRPRLT